MVLEETRMNRAKQLIYVTDRENAKYWHGYLPGLARWGFTKIKRTVYAYKMDDEGEASGFIKTPKGNAAVYKMGYNDYWEFF
jgi:hypothetical protein